MRVRQATLPLGFFVLSSVWPAPLLLVEFSWSTFVLGGLFFGALGGAPSTVVFLLLVDDSSTPRRGAVAAPLATLVAAIAGLPVFSFAYWLVETIVLGRGVDFGPNVLVGSMLLGCVALVLSPITAALGYGVASEPSRMPSLPRRLEAVDRAWLRRSPSTRALVVAFAVLAAGVGGAAGVQYADPTTADVGDAPAYAGPAAAAEAQVEQAQARTRSVSHTVVWTVPADGADTPSRMDDRLVLRHDMQRDVLLFTTRFSGTYQTNLVTVDGHWYWPGNETTPPTAAAVTRRDEVSVLFPHYTPVALDAPASVTDRGEGYVEIAYEAAGGTWHNPGTTLNGTRTVRIDTKTGRVVAVTDRNANGTVFARIRFEDYRATNVDPPSMPVGSIERVVEDLFHGPLTGDGTLY
ncbi:hypothetical protein [Halorubellus litoreus]|uniref:Uncharacterized protein n=1 Tax=Halorubellus litoreus TaxID=755308 RepID=A0ABD5VCI9_9EURY